MNGRVKFKGNEDSWENLLQSTFDQHKFQIECSGHLYYSDVLQHKN